jgi:hypothetical protein
MTGVVSHLDQPYVSCLSAQARLEDTRYSVSFEGKRDRMGFHAKMLADPCLLELCLTQVDR